MHQRIIDEYVLAVVELKVLRQLPLYHFPVPLLQHPYEKPKLLATPVEGMLSELFDLELRVLLADEQCKDIVPYSGAIVLAYNLLQRGQLCFHFY